MTSTAMDAKNTCIRPPKNGVGDNANAHMLFMDKDGKVQSVLKIDSQYGAHENSVITAQSGDVNADGYTDYLFFK